MGDETKQNLCLRGLESSAGYLQSKVGKRIDTRYTPKLQFSLDKGMQHAMMVTRILEDVLPREQGAADAQPDDAQSDLQSGIEAVTDNGDQQS